MTPEKALDLVVYIRGLQRDMTIRQYFKLMLRTLFTQAEGFSGKRPLGNSSWYWELSHPLIKAGCIDEDDDEQYDEFIMRMIEAL